MAWKTCPFRAEKFIKEICNIKVFVYCECLAVDLNQRLLYTHKTVHVCSVYYIVLRWSFFCFLLLLNRFFSFRLFFLLCVCMRIVSINIFQGVKSDLA